MTSITEGDTKMEDLCCKTNEDKYQGNRSIINKFKDVWIQKTSNVIKKANNVDEGDEWDDDAGMYWFDCQRNAVDKISRILVNTLQSLNDEHFVDKISHICGCVMVIVDFYKRLDRDRYYNSHEEKYQYEIDQWKKLVQSNDVSFSDRLLCVKVIKQLFDSELSDYITEKYSVHVDGNEYSFTWQTHTVLLHFVKASNINELVTKYKLWVKSNYIDFDADDSCNHIIYPFFPAKHQQENCSQLKYPDSNETYGSKLWNWELRNLCIDNTNLYFFQEFVEKTKVFELDLSKDYFDEGYWFSIVHQCFNSLCMELFEKNVSTDWLNQQYAEYITFLQKYFSIEKLEQLDSVAVYFYFHALTIGIPAFIEVQKIDYFRELFQQFPICSSYPPTSLIDKINAQSQWINPNYPIKECTNYHNEVIQNITNFAVRLKDFKSVSLIIDCIVQTVDDKNLEYHVKHLFMQTDVKNYLKLFTKNSKKLFCRLYSTDFFDIHLAKERYLNVMKLFLDTFGIDLIKDHNIMDAQWKNTFVCTLLYSSTMCNDLEQYLQYLDMSKVVNNRVVSLEIILEAMKCIRNRAIMFIDKNDDADATQHRNNKNKCYDQFIELILETQMVDGAQKQICELIHMVGTNPSEFLFDTVSAVYITSGILIKYTQDNEIKKSWKQISRKILIKCLNFWGDRFLNLSTKKQLQNECEKLQQYI